MVGQFQFLDKVMAGLGLCNDSCRCSMGCSTLTSCWCAHCHAVTGFAAWCSSCAMAGSTVDTGAASVPGCFGRCVHIFFAKANLDPEVVSCPALRCLVLRAECRSVHRRCFSCFLSWWSHLEIGLHVHEPFHSAVFVRCSGVA